MSVTLPLTQPPERWHDNTRHICLSERILQHIAWICDVNKRHHELSHKFVVFIENFEAMKRISHSIILAI